MANENRQLEKLFVGSQLFILKRRVMFLQLNHHQFDVYTVPWTFVKDCHILTKSFPQEEKFAMVQQIKRAALSVYLNIDEGFSRKSEAERKRFFEIARGSVIEVDAALDIASDLLYCKKEELLQLGSNLTRTFSMLSKLISH